MGKIWALHFFKKFENSTPPPFPLLYKRQGEGLYILSILGKKVLFLSIKFSYIYFK